MKRVNEDPIRLPGLTFRDLFQVDGLRRLDQAFQDHLAAHDAGLKTRLADLHEAAAAPPSLEYSELLLALAPHLESFIGILFGIESELAAQQERVLAHDPVMAFKKEFVLKRARRYRGAFPETFAALDAWLGSRLQTAESNVTDRELAVARFAVEALREPQVNADTLDRLTRWCALALNAPEARARVTGWVAFRLPQPVDPGQLVTLQPVPGDPAGRMESDPTKFRKRDGFKLTDLRMPLRAVQAEVHYCVYCHDHDGDFCSKGFPEKKGKPELGLKVNALGSVLTGCPLEEKISEMHCLQRDGHTLAALAVVMVDNPMVPATGHRICNDCMKGCIYQKQDPVNIPEIETRVLTDVLNLPWGVEIYDLLTRWNPLRHRQYRMQAYNGRKVLIAGLGPAGFTMAHHLTMEGCAVVGIDGLKIEPLPESLLQGPVRDYGDLGESLDRRINYGFGGVAEYGITVRWDKNFLKLIYLTLARRPTFQAFGGVRLGGTVTLEDAWQLGFDHVCNACGTGLPRVIPMGNSLARGMRQASDFLMALQLTGAAKADSLANLQVRLPAVVIGGGLTAVDTATEVQAYYIVQVEKLLARHEELVERFGAEKILARLDDEGRATLEEFLEHGRAVRAERRRAAAAGAVPDFVPLLREWGGVTLVYRRGMNESPAYLRNHEEIIKALEEGVYYAEGLEPLRAELNAYGHVSALVCRRRKQHEGRWLATTEESSLPARAIFVAAGAVPNTIYEREHPGTFELDGNHFLPHVCHRRDLQPVQSVQHCKEAEFGPFTSYRDESRCVTFIGDTHPAFHGSVVKAVASALRSYPQVMHALEEGRPADDCSEAAYQAFRSELADLLTPRVHRINLDNPSVVELEIRAPLAARNFRPGQFYRLQTFEGLSPVVHATRLQIPLQTVSGAGVDGDNIRLFVLRGGANPRLAAALKPGQPLVLMGPAGAPTPIEPGRTVLVIAGRWGAAVMFSLGRALRAAGDRVLYMATFRSADELYYQEELEAGADRIVWATAQEPRIESRRPQDISVVNGNVLDLIRRYGDGALEPDGASPIPLQAVDEIMVMGSTGLLRGLQVALKGELQRYFRSDVQAMGTVGSPMQCMLQGVCAQCLQWQIDPETGERTRAVFSCAMQDQPLFWIDLDNLAARQSQNRLQDYLSDLWLSHVLEHQAR
ncbi:MAG TPA: pyridine nucleotide-disulfide oxidoreductase [Gammaproteobacteria bacterium]|nr:pyridine nucleotide-disulfide oxidoreductase [Gammaproteobacteria bacterium]